MKNKGNILEKGQKLKRNEYLMSSNRKYILVMQGDGNLVHKAIWQPGNDVNWNAETDGEGDHVIMQGDGNLCIYDKQKNYLWGSDTDGEGQYTIVENGGLCVVYGKKHSKAWETPQAPRYESKDIDCIVREAMDEKYDWDLWTTDGKRIASGKENGAGIEFSATIDGGLSVDKDWLPRRGEAPKASEFIGNSAGLLYQLDSMIFVDKDKNQVGIFTSEGIGIGYTSRAGAAVWWPVN